MMTRWRWPLWLLLSVVLLAVPALAWATRAWWPGWSAMLGGLDTALCDLPAALQQLERDAQALHDEERALRRDLAAAEERVLARRAACRAPAQVAQQPPPAPPPQPPQPPPPQARPPDDLERRLQREGAQRGELNVSLAWDTRDDLDLWIICPDGRHVSWTDRSGCRATLDVDANAGGGGSTRPVENIFWTRIADGPPGRYRIEIENFAGGANRWRVRVTVGGRTCDFQGTIGPSRTRVAVATFTLPEATIDPCPAARAP
jgi:hypothetical protein